jgi:TfoX/Sxy family transcriptional regulator of competence genes
MSGSKAAAEAAVEVLAPIGDVTVHRFFGGWGLRCEVGSSPW